MRPPDHIAIVGIGCLFPQAPDLRSYWRNIVAATDCITDVPADHSWSVDDYYDADPKAADRTWCTRGGFLDGVPFDPVKFGIPPTHLESIDTTQLLGLIVARQALQDAGLDPDGDGWDRDRVSAILGITGTQEMAITAGARLQGPIWRKSMLRCGIDPALAEVVERDIAAHFPTWTEQTFPGLLGNVVSGRIANRLDLGGTNCVVDAACASSLAAMQYAISDLQTGRSDLVLTGGADTLNDAFMYQCFTRTPAFTKNGDARPFDSSADGILIGEGIAITALKRLADAERDGDRVYAVIKGLGSSSDGRYRSIYAPNPDGQAKALRRTYAMADIGAETIELVEAHGTGTKAGDVAEISALKTVYGESGRSGRWVALGTVKSQIGHTKSTAGAAGLVKAALALHQRVLPPTAKVELPNPKMGFDDSPFFLNTEARPWVRDGAHPRRAAVSAFGFGGSNYHAVLEEHGDADSVFAMGGAESELFLLGADDDGGLRAALDAVDLDAPTLNHAAREVLSRWTPGQGRVLAFTAASPDALVECVDQARARLDGAPAAPGSTVWLGSAATGGEAPTVGLVFPGQGSQYVHMGRTLAVRHAPVRAALDAADEAFRSAGLPSVSAKMFPPPAYDEGTHLAQAEALTATEWAQPAIGALSAGMVDLLGGFGVHGDVFAGHSYGELVALYAAGVLDRQTLFTASRVRGELMSATDRDRGTMAVVNGPLADIESCLGDHPEVVLANRNHPQQGVVSGPTDAVRSASAALEDAGLAVRPLRVAAAFHSPCVQDAHAPFAAALADLPVADLPLSDASRPVFATATGAPYPADPDAARALLAEQIVRPVDWVAVIEGMYAKGARVFVECGPRGVLAGLIQQILGDRPATVIALDRLSDREDGDTQLKWALAQLAVAGVPIDVSRLLAERPAATPMVATSTATVWLAGANHRFAETLEPPMPDLPRPVPTGIVGAAATASDSTLDLGWASVPSSGAPVAKPVHLESTRPETLPTTLPTAGAPVAAAPTVPAGDLAALLASTRATLESFQHAQERTADVHAQFLLATAKANDNFARLFEAQTRLLQVASGQAPSEVPRVVPPVTVPVPPLAPPAVAPPPMPPTEELFTSSGWDASGSGRVNLPNGATTAVSNDLPPLFDAQAAVEGKAGAGPTPQASSAPADRVSRTMLVQAMLAAVTDKTGYPLDTLELTMDLESDLGVDSIKRVEILSAVRDAVPALPELDNDALGALRTLDEVVGHLDRVLGASAPPRSVPVVSGPSRESLVHAMLTAVAHKTGYPLDTLELTMDLESDLGVDSIKRVEILSAVRDAVPALPELDNDAMGALRTLQQVVDHLAEVVGTGAQLPTILQQPVLPSRDALVANLLDAVAEKTGYPRDTLELTMDLESDLGVDSIKRVEILSAVRDRVPELPELDNDALAALRTLSEVADHLAHVAAGLGFAWIGGLPEPASAPSLLVPPQPPPTSPAIVPGLPPVQSASELVSQIAVGLRRRPVTLAEAPAAQPSPSQGPWVLTRDLAGRADALADALQARGVVVEVVDPDWSSASPLAGIDRAADLDGVVHLAALGATGEALRDRVRGAFALAQWSRQVRRFATVSGRGGAFARRDAAGHPLEGALAGLPKTLQHEWAGTSPLALDVHPDGQVDAWAVELLQSRGTPEVGVHPQGVWVLTATDAEQAEAAELPVGAGDLVIVTGGARGVTAAVAAQLARHAAPAMLLLGRSEVPDTDPEWAVDAPDDALQSRYVEAARADDSRATPREISAAVKSVVRAREVRATLANLGALGSPVSYRAVDVRDSTAVGSAIEAAVAIHGPVKGIVHGAGVLADKAALDKTAAQFDSVFSTKVDGLEAVLGAVDVEHLELVALFTSISGRFGNAGQCDYAMANEALVHRGLQLKGLAPQCTVRAFDWGPWDGGMVTSALKSHFHAKGHQLIPMELGAAFFTAELAPDGPVEVVVEASRPSRGTVPCRLPPAAPWLNDHQIRDTPVVPAAMVLEWMCELAREVVPAMRVAAVHDLAVLKGVTADDAGQLELSWHPVTVSPTQVVLAIELKGTEAGPLGLPVTHYRATVELDDQPPPRDLAPEPNGLGKDAYPYALREAYQRFLFHGPALRGIDEIVGMSDKGAVAWLETSTPSRLGVAEEHWVTDPVAVDSILQLMLLWVREKQGSAALPSALGEYRQFGPLRGRVQCRLQMDDASDRKGRFAATLTDEGGHIVATLAGGQYTADRALLPEFQHPG